MGTPFSAVIFDTEGTSLTENEKAFFREVNPFGYILFARHCQSPDSVRQLVDELKSLSGRDDLPVLIDQEGGRVARLKPPEWPAYPPARAFNELAAHSPEQAKEAVYLNARLIASDLHALGITVDCAPLADIPVQGAHDIIGDRAFGHEPRQVVALARAMANGLLDGGVVPVLKHIPGHGRAAADSHLELPVVNEPLETLRLTDFVPFRELADLPMGMTAHVKYTAIDGTHMATLSPAVICLIREEIGFQGLLLSDDIAMKAMAGSLNARAHDALAAGCDIVLHCNASLQEKQEAVKGVIPLSGEPLARAQRAMACLKLPQPFDVAEARLKVNEMLLSA